MTARSQSSVIAVLLHDLRGGGAERVSLNLAKGLVKAGRSVDLVLVRAQGTYIDQIPAGVRLVDLNKSNVFKAVPALVRYLRKERPKGIISSLSHVNVVALVARFLSGARSRLVVTEHNQISYKAARDKSFRGQIVYRALPFLYRFADQVVAVSEGVAADVETFCGFKPGTVKRVYNPIYDETTLQDASQPVDHPWLKAGQPPVILAAGRLHEQKGFDLLLKAFRIVRRSMPCRLIIMGEGEERPKLEALIDELGVGADVSLMGFVANPHALMARAAVFVVSSRWEGFSLVLVEAMACGAVVVSTDCPSGPREVLDGGRYGALVPVEDVPALADAIVQALGQDGQGDGGERAKVFSIDAATSAYLGLLEQA